MGQVESSGEGPLGAVDSIQQQLDVLERTLSSIEDGYQTRLAADALDGSTAPTGNVVICGAQLACRGHVRILTGPVVGRVDGSSAMILLEVDTAAAVDFHWCIVDEHCAAGRHVGSLRVDLTARRPKAVALTRLLPGARYVVCFGGVHRSDAVRRTAEFVTHGSAGKKQREALLRFCAVSGDRTAGAICGEGFDRWETLRERVSQRALPPLNCMLHVGGQVDLRCAFDRAWVSLRRAAEARAGANKGAALGSGESWLDAEERCAETLRDAYRLAWNLPGKRNVLASCPHFMLASDVDVYPSFQHCEALSPDVGGQVAATMIRLARRVFWEYQRALWDARVPDLVRRDEELSRCRQAVANTTRALARRTDLAAVATAHFDAFKTAARATAAAGGTEEKKARVAQEANLHRHVSDLEKAKKLAAADAADAGAALEDAESAGGAGGAGGAGDETSLHVLGDVALLLVDTTWSRVGPDGAIPRADADGADGRGLVAEAAWDQLESLLLHGALDVSALVVATAEAPLSPFGARAQTQWLDHPADQRRLVELCLGFCRRGATRSCLIVAGGDVGAGVETLVRDLSSDASFRQLTVGSITGWSGDRPAAADDNPLRLEHSSTLTDGATPVSTEHRRTVAPADSSYLEGVAAIPRNKLKATRIRAELCSLFYGGITALLGPVIGAVTANSAVVLLEVSNDAPVACIVTDALTGESQRQLRFCRGRRPFAFRFEALRAGRFYYVYFGGIERADDRRGSFSTWPNFAVDAAKHRTPEAGGTADAALGPAAAKYAGFLAEKKGDPVQTFRLVALSGDAALTPEAHPVAARKALKLWGALRGVLDTPFGGADVVAHLGAQVEIASAIPETVALLSRAEAVLAQHGDSAQAARLEEAALDRLRDAYRAHWNAPMIRASLAHGSHIMARGLLDDADLVRRAEAQIHRDAKHCLLPLSQPLNDLAEAPHGGHARRRFRRLAQQVFREYQRQLWEPLATSADAAVDGARDGGAGWGSAGRRSHGCSDARGNGEWFFHTSGPVGIFVLDLRELRGSGSAPDFAQGMLSVQQWTSLEEVLQHSPGLRILYVCSELPFVDDSTTDARFKSTQPETANAQQGWPAHAAELHRLLAALFDWERACAGRKATLVAGGGCAYATSVTCDTFSERDFFDTDGAAATERSECTQTLAQLVVGPVGVSSTPPLFEMQGALSRDMTYSHHGVEGQQNFGSVKAQWSSETDAVHYDARSHFFPHKDPAAGRARLAHALELAPRRPAWLARLHDFGQGDSAVEAEVAESFSSASAREDLCDMFEAEIFPREVEAFAASVSTALFRFYHAPSQAQLRDVAPLPSILAVRAVAAKWDAQGPRLADGTSTARVSLAFLDAGAFEVFVAECFQLSRGVMLRANALKDPQAQIDG
ncbi:hypothetical protein M885DRAFT_514512 [Pelagophyceae sp. CCMP2097]|nr:hypothetical protein M885DRAFT_514512 [Pelagophyceae sp. CCMP2097]